MRHVRRKLEVRAETLRALATESLELARGGGEQGVVTVPGGTFVYSCDNYTSCGFSTIVVCTNRAG